ncbi:kinase-like protein [Byssothecium circinans]|uniref:Kinase-like protein n=1 Tax=Byssothecium circinans TaxID=147558 RepID=A0A6A5TZY6_9PLEO|nr:kinase-like protein [Byssothecium circinans]
MRLHTDLVKDSKFWKTSQDRDRIYTRHTSIETSGHGDNIRGQELGRGAFGIVWKEKLVDGESDAKERAVKMIRKQFGKSKIDYARELEAIAKFSRGRYKLYFVESFGWYESLDDVFIAMEYFEHGDLENYLLEVRNMPENDVRIISNQVLKGVEQMHVNRFAHRDLKPGNILIRRLGDHKLGWLVKIGDFGISKRAEEGMTALRTFGGSSGYIAPEILVKDNRLFPTAHVHDKLEVEKEGFALVIDIWAVGSIIYRALCGVTPFETGLLAYVNGKEFSAHELNEFSVSTEGIGLIRKLLEVYPDDRLTAAEALEDPWFNELQVNSPRSSGEYE